MTSPARFANCLCHLRADVQPRGLSKLPQLAHGLNASIVYALVKKVSVGWGSVADYAYRNC
jgi:hypothetical protein